MPKGLYGSYAHKLDSKSRVVLPARYRDELGQSVMATIGIEKCIFAYPMLQWEALQERLSAMRTGSTNERKLRMIIMTSAQELEVDSAGRILLPQKLRDYANINQEVSINGTGDRLEIWDLVAWNEFWSRTADNIQEIAEGVGWL
ncbi:MAG: division/cell wall cluster transcriptional repressor MraZ [Synergistaceae bacterium]|nr:division/cell wall cluster transcriptional repressor MraZ [Synergistaceae bacterium]